MLKDVGVLPDSIRFYREPDTFTAANLCHAPHAGIYHCDRQYVVQRDEPLHACQIIIVDAGELGCEYLGQHKTVPSGAILLLDCRTPHRYYAVTDDLRMRWFHMVGGGSEAYTQLILQSQGFVLPIAHSAAIETCCERVLTVIRRKVDEPHMLSVALNDLLAHLAIMANASPKSELEQAIQSSAAYMDTHFADKTTSVEQLAHRAAMSTCYYLRKFKEYRAVTPHQYLLNVRLRAAKEQLTTTSRSVEEIAEACGFCSTSHLVSAFRKGTGLTPLQFRIKWR
ncbi:AraC family transcriptional regulator [Butyricicoccus faecihominis]|uniref:AraC family transcriptional regulator n=1 Tax=Butyricicoccus faecihominis TaxID=1712515 RepID=UPI00247A1212|nr:AraC family transcriptional regulator [Butyricicoccus faecihominis]MCQ5128746.1 AraC family transcriptional regulator [Butyricicoccus faecihominis]